jgi:cobalamin biosynthesis Mg chelatase CobN
MSGERNLLTAVQLAEAGVLTPAAARALAYFSQHGLVCRVQQMRDSGAVGIVYRERWYTPAAFNALVAGRYEGSADQAGDNSSAISNDARDGGADAGVEAQITAVALVERGLLTQTDAGVGPSLTFASIEAAARTRAEREQRRGAALWAMGAVMLVAVVFAVVTLWAFAHGVWAGK